MLQTCASTTKELAEYALVADQLFRIEVIHLERHFSWLHAQCRGNWIFRIDADEIASPALVSALPELMARREIRQAWFPRKWLYGESTPMVERAAVVA